MLAMKNASESAEELLREMRSVRSDLGEDMEKFVENARVMTDWHYYIRRAPWLSLGTAAALGYLLIPSKPRYVRPDLSQLAELAKHHDLVVTDRGEKKQEQASMTSSLVKMATGTLLRAGLGVLGRHVNQIVQGSFSRPSATYPNGEVPAHDHD